MEAFEQEIEQSMNQIRMAQAQTEAIIQRLKACKLPAQSRSSDLEEIRQIVEGNCRRLGIPLPNWDDLDSVSCESTKEIVIGNLCRLGLPLPPEWIDEVD